MHRNNPPNPFSQGITPTNPFSNPNPMKKTYKRQKNAPEKQIAFPERLLFLSSVIR